MSFRTNVTNYNKRRLRVLHDLAKNHNWRACVVCRKMFDLAAGKGGPKEAVCPECLAQQDKTHIIPCDVSKKRGTRKTRGVALTVPQNMMPALFKRNPERFIQQRYVYMRRETVRALRRLLLTTAFRLPIVPPATTK